ncbi:hypothetical protein [Paenarthrobacter sp. AMU7]|uniref:Uncharacterized protein n=1 Tax=Paenarthrobacter sp. AMU7 TaxID=3162492 RepID=A0AB39YTY3_9MICC
MRTKFSALITAFAERGDELHGIAAGATAYLINPFRPANYVNSRCN